MLSRAPHILVVDDHAVVRRGLNYLLLAQVPGARVVGVSTCAALQRELAIHAFDLVLLDLVLPDGNTVDLLPDLLKRYPHLRVLMYSMSAEEVYAERAAQLGAMGFVSKAEDEDELIRAVRLVLRDNPYVSPGQKVRVLDRPTLRAGKDPFHQLSQREISVMDHLLHGRTVGEIAALLDVGGSTAATYKARLFNKLGVANVLELQRKADAHGYRIS